MWKSSFADAFFRWNRSQRGSRVRARSENPLALAWLAVGVLALLLGHAFNLLPLAPLQRLELALYDLRLNLLVPHAPDGASLSVPIVIVDIDERALAARGRWPWHRSDLAELLERLTGGMGARLVGLDIVLADDIDSASLSALDRLLARPLGNTPTGPLPALRETLQSLRKQLDGDARLAEVLQRRPVVMGFLLSGERGATTIGELPTPIMPMAALGSLGLAMPEWNGHGGNLARLQRASTHGAGHLNALVDADGVVRRVPMLVQKEGQIHGSLALAMARWLLDAPDQPAALLRLAPAQIDAMHPLQSIQLRGREGLIKVPVDRAGAALVPFSVANRAFLRISAADVLAGAVDTGLLRGKVVLLGVSAPGLVDQRITPVDDAMQGTAVHASLLAGMLSGQMLATPAAAPLYELLQGLLVAGVMVLALLRLGLAWSTLVAALLMLGLVTANAAAWLWGRWYLPLASGLVVPGLLMVLHLLLAYRAATSARQGLTRLFGQYVPPELVHELSLQPERQNMSSRNAELTVLFADVQGFTRQAERLPPGELSATMNLVFSHLTDIVRQHRGTLDKYIGDSVMAFWGAPLDDPDHARHAVTAALAMRDRLPAMRAELAARGWPDLNLSIGINTGVMVVGNMGSRHRLAYTVMGDAVNLAARLQSVCARDGLGLVIGDATRRALGEQLCLSLGPVLLRGRNSAEQIWQPLAWQPGQNLQADRLAALWARLQQATDSGQSELAATLLSQLQQVWPDDALCRWQNIRLVAQAGTVTR